MAADGNKLEVVEGVSVQSWDWRNLGAVFSNSNANNQCVAARCNFTVRRGYDAIDQVDYGRVVEGLGDLGVSLRSKQYAFHVSASNLAYRAGDDAPLAAQQSVVGGALASLKFAFAQEYGPDQYVAISYDLKQRKPELSLAWSGDTPTEKAAVSLTLDPVDRAVRLAAAVSFPGPEWRDDVWDEDNERLQLVGDDGGRHTLWVEHAAVQGNLVARTRAGARLDVGRAANWAADVVDYRLKGLLPPLLWRLPLSRRLYNLLVPALDLEQVRHHISGWHVELSHDFEAGAAAAALTRKLGAATLGAGYDWGADAAELSVRLPGLRAAARLGRKGPEGWGNPSLRLMVEPLAFL